MTVSFPTKGQRMNQDEFVHHRNVAIYMRQLRYAPDAGQRTLLMSRLAAERARARAKGWGGFGPGADRGICAGPL